jgi:type IV pilus assembly protein PilY1
MSDSKETVMIAPPPNQFRKRRASRRHFGVGWTALFALGALPLAPSLAHAQVDVAPPLPNVMLLVDTSGSMEYRTDGSEVTCTPGNAAGTNHKSRWIDLVEVLTGTIDSYSCQAVDRLSDDFKTGEYQLTATTTPYDYKYPIPYHRPLSNGCAPGPGNLPSNTNPFIYPTGGVSYHAYLDETLSCSFSQSANDGILDAYDNAIRFGLMTFDTALDAGMGITGQPGSASADLPDGIDGLWSYISSYAETDGHTGAPIACERTPQEVGARNAAAPPWEGRMVNFGNPANGLSAQLRKREQIEEILLATRPYGATPIAGMLQDAEDFFTKDSSIDQDPEPLNATFDFGPKDDPYVEGGCRDQAILLLTDGQPNLDLRPHCEAAPPEHPTPLCPFDEPDAIVKRLATATASKPKIPTYVIGFALDEAPTADGVKECSKLEDDDCAGLTDDSPVALQACCTLRKIAVAGAPAGEEAKAYFASDRDALRDALNEILSDLVPGASRTQVVAATGGGGNFRFSSGFKPLRSTTWRGELLRQRFSCEAAADDGPKVPKAEDIDKDTGDDFVHNVNQHHTDRNFYTYKGTLDGAEIHSADPIRPLLTTDDGLGTYGGSVFYGKTSTFATTLGAAAMDIGSADCGTMNATNCAQHYLKWVVGLDNGTANSRCPSTNTCNVVGDILHSTPQVVNRPNALVESESYARFALNNAERPVVLYTSTNDGFLHAFKVASNDATESSDSSKVLTDDLNELWAFAPPAVLPKLPNLYPNNHQLLLDGVPVIKDVVAVEADDVDELPTVFERTDGDLLDSAGTWRTVLVQSFGADHDGYFALDVTNPVPDAGSPSDLTKGGPRMLWQLTGSDTNHLFGRGGSTPAIATLFFDPDGTGAREVAVAILPGGPGTAGTDDGSGGGCAKDSSDFDSGIEAAYAPRTEVRCYPNDKNIGARSLTIVRLDNGQLVRTFRQSKDEVPASIQDKVEEVPIDSPITGQPAPFPAEVGAISNRAFVGDHDGRLWKVDFSSPDPSAWTMSLFFDLFPAGTTNHDFDDGQPITTAPVLSVDEVGNLTLNVSTGDQDALGAVSDQVNYVWSLTERLSDDRTSTEARVNWYQPFVGGERVVGPMSLFNRGLFFATYTPDDGDVCKSGSGRVWGMDYTEPNSDGRNDGGTPSGLSEDSQFLTAAQLTGTDDGSIVFGVSVAQQISCYDITSATTGTSAIGFKGEQKLSQINPGKFQLLIQTGSGKGVGGTPKVFAQDLATPTSEGFLASWASVED